MKVYPLDAPGIDSCGPDMRAMAEALGDTVTVTGKGKKVKITREGNNLEKLVKAALYSRGEFSLNLTVKGTRKVPTAIVGGHLWGEKLPSGPRRADVMVISKVLGEEGLLDQRSFTEAYSRFLDSTLVKLGVDNHGAWYVTNLLKCTHPENGSRLAVSWIKEFLPLLKQELRLVRPKYILCLGSDVSKTLLGKDYTVGAMAGRVVEYTYPVHLNYEDEPEMHTALVMASMHPAAIMRDMDSADQFEHSLTCFSKLVNGIRWDKAQADVDQRTVSDADTLRDLIEEITADEETYVPMPDGISRPVIALDAEWHGKHPQNAGAYCRTIQVSWANNKGACITLRKQGGEPGFEGGEEVAIELLNLLLKRREDWDIRIVGHFLNADLEWLLPVGLDLREEFAAPDNWEEFMSRGGFDTGLAAHTLNETDDFSLTSQTLRYVGTHRYDVDLDQWKSDYCKKQGIKKGELEGYGECPDEILIPYSIYDAIVTRQLFLTQLPKLVCDSFENCCWEQFWVSTRAAPSVLEMNCTGITVDKAQVDELTRTYMIARENLKEKVCNWAAWPDFNINSPFHVRELLFGEELNGKQRPEGSPPIRLRPPGARTLKLQPILTTGKPPKTWREVVSKKKQNEYTPGTDKQVLGILCEESQSVRVWNSKEKRIDYVDYSQNIGWLRDYRFISQVLKSLLRPPAWDDEQNSEELNDEGGYVYEAGLPKEICDDGRVRTHLYQTLETGRWASARPGLQNCSKSREADYKRILGKDYTIPLRGIFIAAPGKVIIESDFSGAELLGMGVMSGDEALIDHCLRGQLSESHPNYYDIHSNIAVQAFKLDCEPSKHGLETLGKAHLRVVAKSVIFGRAYGRGAKAIALAVKEQGVNITVEEAQQLIDALDTIYPLLPNFFQECRDRATGPRWLCGPFGRFRRFPVVVDRVAKGELERQAMNAPIQGLVADAMSRALDHLYTLRKDFDVWYDLLLQIHDAVVLEAEAKYVPKIVDEVIPHCLTKSVPIYPCALDGIPNGTGPYRLGAETEIFLQWGVVPMPDKLLELGVDPKYAHWKPVDSDSYKHSKYPRKIWTQKGFVDA